MKNWVVILAVIFAAFLTIRCSDDNSNTPEETISSTFGIKIDADSGYVLTQIPDSHFVKIKIVETGYEYEKVLVEGESFDTAMVFDLTYPTIHISVIDSTISSGMASKDSFIQWYSIDEDVHAVPANYYLECDYESCDVKAY